VVVFLAAAVPCLAADPLPKAELARRGKASTILVEVKAGTAFASAFCVHPSGLFVTSEQAARQAGSPGPVVVLNPGDKGQKVLKATVVRRDKDAGLALLRVEGAGKLAALPLGGVEDLIELMDVAAFGFPFGAALTLDKDEYPAMSVNPGSVTSLRKKAGELVLIQVDVALNPGNSGGPLLDRYGKIVGVVAAGIPGAGINFAIPVNRLERFLARPDVQFTPPVITRANCGHPVMFEVRVAPILPSSRPMEAELTLRGADGKERKHKMKRDGDAFRVTAVPAPDTGEVRVQATIIYTDGFATGPVADQAFIVGDQKLRLGEARTIRFRPKAQVVRHDGKALDGEISGLDVLEVVVDDKPVRFKLAGATEVRLEAPRQEVGVAYSLVVTQEEHEVARLTGQLGAAISTAAQTSLPVAPAAPVRPPVLEQDKVVRTLPATVSDLAVGGAGRFLILHLPKLHKLAIFDANEAKIVQYINLASNNVKFAAGQDKLMVVLPEGGIVQRWSLKTFEREVSAVLPVNGIVRRVLMGAASQGPLVVAATETAFFDIQTLKRLPVAGEGFSAGDGVFARVSGDGTVFGVWRYATSPQGIHCCVLVGNQIKVHYQHTDAGHLTPGPDGKVIFSARGLFTSEGKPLNADGFPRGPYSIPARQGNYYLTLEPGRKDSLAVHLVGDSRPLVRLPHVEQMEGINHWDREEFGFDQRFHFIPEARLLVTIPTTNDRLVLYRFDVDEALEKAGIDYLLVTSDPPRSARKGQTFAYELAVKAKRGPVKFKLESGPPAMMISDTGRIGWTVPADVAEKETAVIVSIKDTTGQECFHSFTISVRD
jgi:hypothetical protein